MTGYAFRRYDQFETSPEAIEQELRPAVCDNDRFKANYSIDVFSIVQVYGTTLCAISVQLCTIGAKCVQCNQTIGLNIPICIN